MGNRRTWAVLTATVSSFKQAARLRLVCVSACAVLPCLAGCRNRGVQKHPAIVILEKPIAMTGGPDQMQDIGGTVQNETPGQQVIVYARSGLWWIQPFANQFYTRVHPDGTWKTTTHLGTDYAALLVDPTFQPDFRLSTLPTVGKGIASITMVPGRADRALSAHVLHFSGYDWAVRSSLSDHGGDLNAYDAANAWVDGKGHLHLRMQERHGIWTCAEVNLTQSLGFGTYRMVVQDSHVLSPSAVLGMFTYDDASSIAPHGEMDIELGRWGRPEADNAQFIVEPFYMPDNMTRFTVPGGVTAHQFNWQPHAVQFASFRGTGDPAASTAIEQKSFTKNVPQPKTASVRLDLFDFHHAAAHGPGATRPVEVVIQSFHFSPH